MILKFVDVVCLVFFALFISQLILVSYQNVILLMLQGDEWGKNFVQNGPIFCYGCPISFGKWCKLLLFVPYFLHIVCAVQFYCNIQVMLFFVDLESRPTCRAAFGQRSESACLLPVWYHWQFLISRFFISIKCWCSILLQRYK